MYKIELNCFLREFIDTISLRESPRYSCFGTCISSPAGKYEAWSISARPLANRSPTLLNLPGEKRASLRLK